MAPVTDLTFEQLNFAKGENSSVFVTMTNTNNQFALFLDVSALLGKLVDYPTEAGVVRLMVMLHELCQSAQATVNLTQESDELLVAFPSATSTGTIVEGKIPQISSIHSRILAASATTIEGATT